MPTGAVLLVSRAPLLALAAAGAGTWWVLRLRRGGQANSDEDTDMTVTVAAARDEVLQNKTLASDPECVRLSGMYERMALQFAESGLDTDGIQGMQKLFHSVDERTPWPKRYDEFPDGPLPDSAVRLLVLPLDASPSLASAAAAVAREVRSVLPASTSVFCNARSNYHVTVFHTSYPSDQRPTPLVPGGGASEPGSAQPTRGPTRDELADEAAAVAGVVTGCAPPELVLDRVVMATSGTLLLTWVDPTGGVDALRAKMRAAFPGACARQAGIIHSSLLRVLSCEPLPTAVRAQVSEVCARWTEKLRGRRVVVPAAWWVTETEFSTIEGERQRMVLGGA